MKKGQDTKTNHNQILAERIQPEPQPPAETEQEQESPNYEIYNNIIYGIVDSFIDAEYPNKSQEELKTDRAFFPRLIDYIYNNYIGELLGNKYGKQVVYKDIKQLDCIFSIYTDLVYKYKWNNRPLIIEFSILTGINRDTFYSWVNGLDNSATVQHIGERATRERSDTVTKWVNICERALIDGNDTIKDLFILKSKHGYKEAGSNEINITVDHRNIINADVLPDLIGINSKD